MSGHNKWSKIKHKKAASDARKSTLFSKYIAAISVAARENPNPDVNPKLRAVINRAKTAKVPNSNIKNALSKASEQKDLQELLVEAYGPEGVGVLIQAITDSSNRTISELKKIIPDLGFKFADPGSVRWAFEQNKGYGFNAKFPQSINKDSQKALQRGLDLLSHHPDVQEISTSAKLS